MHMAHHFTLPPHVVLNARVMRVLHSVSCLLCAMLALDGAMCNMKNSMFVTPVSAHVARTIVAHAGVRWVLRVISIWFGA